MELGEFDLPLLKQHIKYLISLSDVKAEFFWFLFTKGAGYCVLAFDPCRRIMLSSSSESE
jgi:hypothetical protein